MRSMTKNLVAGLKRGVGLSTKPMEKAIASGRNIVESIKKKVIERKKRLDAERDRYWRGVDKPLNRPVDPLRKFKPMKGDIIKVRPGSSRALKDA